MSIFETKVEMPPKENNPEVVCVPMTMAEVQLRNFTPASGPGRDIGTHVLPNADIKIFLTASIEERAKRRWTELGEKGFIVDLTQLQQEIACRDQMDCEREIAPLIQAADAVLIDTTGLTINQAVELILTLCKEKGNGL